MAAVVNWQISVFHIFPFFAPCIAIFSTMRYPSATSSTIITLKPTAKKNRADVRVLPLRHFRDQLLHHHMRSCREAPPRLMAIPNCKRRFRVELCSIPQAMGHIVLSPIFSFGSL